MNPTTNVIQPQPHPPHPPGEHAVPSATGETSLGVTERIVERTEPGPTCPNPNEPILDTEGHRVGKTGHRGTMDI